MKKLDIETKDGFIVAKDLPVNCLFNKGRTASGGTTIVIQNDENYIIAVPTTELITNKCFPPKNRDGKDNIWKKKDIRPGLSPVLNLFGLYGNSTQLLKTQLKNYLAISGVKKIICTYDKIPFLLGYINPKEYRLLIDEYHSFLKMYSIRDKAVNGVLDNFREFKSYCFMSATPMNVDFRPEELKDIPECYIDWKETLTIKIFPYQTDKTYFVASQIIEKYKKNGYYEIEGIKSYEAYFFINSVTDIKKILDKAGLQNEECRIICADTSQNRTKLSGYDISSSTDAAKKFNFITSKSFEGVDYYSDSGLCFVISNAHNKNTLLSIDMDIPQIAGRIRTKTNPHRFKVVHIFNSNDNRTFQSYEGYKAYIKSQENYARERAEFYNKSSLSKGAKMQQRTDMEKLSNSSYLRYNKNNDEYIVNDMIGKLQLHSYRLLRNVYNSGDNLKGEYLGLDMKASNIKWEIAPDDYIKNSVIQPTFRDSHKRYIQLKEAGLDNDEVKQLEEEYPILKEGFEKLGIKKLKGLREKKNIKKAMDE